MIRKFTYWGLLTSAIVLVGCSQHKSIVDVETTVIPANTSLKTKPEEVRVIQPKNYVLGTANAVEVKEIRTITLGDSLEVQFNLFNNRGRRDIVYYRMRWLDKAGVMIGQYAPWESETLEGFQSSVLTFKAPTPQINDFRLEIRPRD